MPSPETSAAVDVNIRDTGESQAKVPKARARDGATQNGLNQALQRSRNSAPPRAKRGADHPPPLRPASSSFLRRRRQADELDYLLDGLLRGGAGRRASALGLVDAVGTPRARFLLRLSGALPRLMDALQVAEDVPAAGAARGGGSRLGAATRGTARGESAEGERRT